MKRFLLLFTATLALFTFVACSDDDDDSPASSGNGNTTSTTNGTGDNSSTTGSSVADSLIGNTYKDMRSGRDENDFWKFESATIVYWGTTKYKYEITIGSPISGIYTKL